MTRKRTFLMTLYTAMFCVFAAAVLVQATDANETGEAAGKLPVVKITSVAQPEPSPPLKYSLTPYYGDIQPGNAANSYYRAILLLPRDPKLVYGDKQSEWANMPLDQLPKDEMKQWLVPYQNVLREVRTATYREDCNWDLRIRDLKGSAPLALLLPEIQQSRTLARVLFVQARLEIAERRFEDALDSLTMGYKLAGNIARSPSLVGHLVGVACAGIMNRVVVDWINAGGPNLYWGLAGLPNPLTDIRRAIEQEMYVPLQMFPFLKDPESKTHGPEEWGRIIGESMARLGGVNRGDLNEEKARLAGQAAGTGLILLGYSSAKEQLIKSGMDPKKVNAMPVGQVVAIRTARAYREIYHEAMKWSLLPYAQGYQQMKASFARMRKEGRFGGPGQTPGVLPIVAMFLPAIEPAFLAPVRMQREIYALQTIEALRMYAAGNNGRCPETLDALRQSPTPLDPITGKPFVYKIEEGRAVLILDPPEGMRPGQFGKRYELELRETK